MRRMPVRGPQKPVQTFSGGTRYQGSQEDIKRISERLYASDVISAFKSKDGSKIVKHWSIEFD